MADQRIGGAFVDLSLRAAQYHTDVRGAEAAFHRMHTGMIGMAAGIVRSLAPIAAGFLSIRAAVSGVTRAFREFREAEDVTAKLNQSMKNAGSIFGIGAQRVDEFAREFEGLTQIQDEVIKKMATTGTNIGHLFGGQLREATKAAIGLAEILNTDVETAMLLISRAAQGQTQMLSRYGIVLDENASKQEKFNKVLEIGARGFSIAQARAETMGGRLQQLKNALDNLFEATGRALFGSRGIPAGLELVTRELNRITDLIDRLKSPGEFFKALGLTLKDIFHAAGKELELAMTAALIKVEAVIKAMTAGPGKGSLFDVAAMGAGALLGQAGFPGASAAIGGALSGRDQRLAQIAQERNAKLALLGAEGSPFDELPNRFADILNKPEKISLVDRLLGHVEDGWMRVKTATESALGSMRKYFTEADKKEKAPKLSHTSILFQGGAPGANFASRLQANLASVNAGASPVQANTQALKQLTAAVQEFGGGIRILTSFLTGGPIGALAGGLK